MKIIKIVPAIYEFTTTPMSDEKSFMDTATNWSWHSLDEITYILNSREVSFSLMDFRLQPEDVIENFAALCCLQHQHPFVTLLKFKDGEDQVCDITRWPIAEFMQHRNFLKGWSVFIPAGWGMRILNAAKDPQVVSVQVRQQKGEKMKLITRGMLNEDIGEINVKTVPVYKSYKYEEP